MANELFDDSRLMPAPWGWEADGDMLMLGTVLPDGNGIDLEKNVMVSHRCKSCQAVGATCMWPDRDHAEFILRARDAWDELMKDGATIDSVRKAWKGGGE